MNQIERLFQGCLERGWKCREVERLGEEMEDVCRIKYGVESLESLKFIWKNLNLNMRNLMDYLKCELG